MRTHKIILLPFGDDTDQDCIMVRFSNNKSIREQWEELKEYMDVYLKHQNNIESKPKPQPSPPAPALRDP